MPSSGNHLRQKAFWYFKCRVLGREVENRLC
jgi:hypothetical protein